jgi:hypothetical protein
MTKPFALALLAASVLASAPAQAAQWTNTWVCYNKPEFGPSPLTLKLTTRAVSPRAAKRTFNGTLQFKEESCRMSQIAYNPVASHYRGWIRVGGSNGCPELGHALFGNTTSSNKPIQVYWLSVSRELQLSKAAFEKARTAERHPGGSVQLGYQNDADPGAGREAKTFLRCYPDRS